VSRRLVFLPEAREDIYEAAIWYKERRADLAREFTQAVKAATKNIARIRFSFPCFTVRRGTS
jgi:plasmid stabilization system protein ParE